ncbi:hypothetical protein D3C81_808720 [compost metagenome]
MNNKLVVWLNKKYTETAETTIKAALKRDYNIDEDDFTKTEGGFEFLFDDETGGHAEIEFIRDDAKAFGVAILADHAWECMELYGLVQTSFEDDEEDIR